MSLKRIIEPSDRRKKLKEVLESNGFARIIEAHNGISGIIANDAKITIDDGTIREFDGMWESSLTDSASKGFPDVELVGFDSRLNTIQDILFVTDKPMIVDGDTGGEATQFEYMCSKLERLGVSAVIIEDKVFPKRNSLEAGANQDLEDPDIFATKIRRGKSVLISDSFMVIARLESLIANKGINDAVNRAAKYLEAGADGIMIHSKQSTPDEVFEFARQYDELCNRIGFRKPLICVPTTYNYITEEEFREKGFNIVIHANHMLRAAYQAMEKVSLSILENSRTLEASPFCATVQEIFDAVGFLDVKNKDHKYSKTKIKAIIPAAGKPSEQFIKEFGEIPPCLIELKGKSIIQRQVETLNNVGISNINVVVGYNSHLITYPNCNKIENEQYSDKYILHSLFKADAEMKDGFVLVYSDILFNESLLRELLHKKGDIVLVVDNSYSYYKKRI
ncbi:MAG: phosphoenolpyruvate mutase, partial [Deltaproteobacteria bacterium]